MPINEELYFQMWDALALFARVNNRMEVSGAENIPAPGEGGAIICPAHSNYSDPFFVGVAAGRRVVHFMAWEGIRGFPLAGPLLSRLGALHSVKVDYGASTDKAGTKRILEEFRALLESGEVCVIFPEGTIKPWIGSGRLKEFKSGALRLAAQARVPIIPAGLSGSRWVFPNVISFHNFGGPNKSIMLPGALPVKVRVRFGEPFHVDPAAADDKAVAAAEAERLRGVVMAIEEEIKPESLMGYVV